MWNWWNGGQGYVTSNSNRGRPKNVKQTYKFKGNFMGNIFYFAWGYLSNEYLSTCKHFKLNYSRT